MVLKAVVWDCDGVLVDSEPLAERAWGHALGMFGYTATPEDYEAVRGRTATAGHAYFLGRMEIPPIDEFRVHTRAYWNDHLDDLRAFPDAVEVVRHLAADGIPMAVASSSGHQELAMKLTRFDLARYFDFTIGGDEVEHGKPAPDLFLRAAEGLGLHPSECLAIDDAEVGADAAVAAGMRTVRLTRDGEISARHAVTSALDAHDIEMWMGLA